MNQVSENRTAGKQGGTDGSRSSGIFTSVQSEEAEKQPDPAVKITEAKLHRLFSALEKR